MAEIYPPHLRSTAASIFNWGRVISFFAPLITAKLAGSFELAAAMASASLTFGFAAVISLLQRETLPGRRQIEALKDEQVLSGSVMDRSAGLVMMTMKGACRAFLDIQNAKADHGFSLNVASR